MFHTVAGFKHSLGEINTVLSCFQPINHLKKLGEKRRRNRKKETRGRVGAKINFGCPGLEGKQSSFRPGA
jgi:hypothetical protein